VVAAATLDGTRLVAYVPPGHPGPITIDMTAMSEPTQARWFDQTTVAYVDAGVGLLPPGTQQQIFTPPAESHVDGFGDWVLVLEKR
jgi:Putative collagen-binding domain of a collagenase